jgi:uncharacterized membrane protein YidH (DUF202 family)
MSLSLTLIILAVAAVVFGLANWRSRKPYEAGQAFAIPYTGLQVVAVVAMIVMLAHLISLMSGTPFKGRMG